MLRPRMNLEVAANGRLMATQPNPGASSRGRLGIWLWFQGFRKDGAGVVGPDEAIFPDYVRADLRLNAGWDPYAGRYLLAADEAGDAFLRSAFGGDLTAGRA